MNIEQAKSIPLSVILDKMERLPQRNNSFRVLYFSPLRQEKTPSLWVNSRFNTWRDFGDFKWEGGDGIHLVRAYLESSNENSEVTDALRWLRNMTGFIPSIKPVTDPEEQEPEKTLLLRRAVPVANRNLIDYGASRGIPEPVLKKYFEQALLFNRNTQKTFTTLCMRNERKGYDLRNAVFKGCIGKKYITFIRGTVPKPEGINIFEGGIDFATVITQNDGKPLEHDSIVLHSLSNLKKATAYIKNYGYRYCYTWMDNDKPGIEATRSWREFCKTEESLFHVPMNELYLPHKDVNAAHMAKLGL